MENSDGKLRKLVQKTRNKKWHQKFIINLIFINEINHLFFIFNWLFFALFKIHFSFHNLTGEISRKNICLNFEEFLVFFCVFGVERFVYRSLDFERFSFSGFWDSNWEDWRKVYLKWLKMKFEKVNRFESKKIYKSKI